MVWPLVLSSAMKRCAPAARLAPAERPGRSRSAVAVDDRRRHPPAVRRPHAVSLRRASAPTAACRPSISDITRPLPLIANTLPVDGIDHRRRPGEAMRRHVAREHVVAVFPEQLAGVGVEAHQPLLLHLACAGRVLQVEAIAEDDRAGAPAVRALATRGSRPPATSVDAGPVSVDTPVRAGPRQSGQSAPRTSAAAGTISEIRKQGEQATRGRRP